MLDRKLRLLSMTALFAALTTLLTLVIRVPSPLSGYLNLGDCGVLLSAWILGPVPGCLASGLGSMAADLLGYPLYAPGTLVIKGLMALAAGALFRCLRQKGPARLFPALLASGAAGELIMTTGYFLYEAAPFPVGLGLGALVNVPFNLVQGGFGLICAGAVYLSLSRAGALARRQ